MIKKQELESIYSLIEDIHENAIDKGFWKTMDTTLEKMKTTLGDNDLFTRKEIIQVKKAFISQKLMLIASELGEVMESDRHSRYTDWNDFEELFEETMNEGVSENRAFEDSFEACVKDTFEDEIADVVIRVFDLTKKLGIDIIKNVLYKMQYNTGRKYLHGKEY